MFNFFVNFTLPQHFWDTWGPTLTSGFISAFTIYWVSWHLPEKRDKKRLEKRREPYFIILDALISIWENNKMVQKYIYPHVLLNDVLFDTTTQKTKNGFNIISSYNKKDRTEQEFEEAKEKLLKEVFPKFKTDIVTLPNKENKLKEDAENSDQILNNALYKIYFFENIPITKNELDTLLKVLNKYGIYNFETFDNVPEKYFPIVGEVLPLDKEGKLTIVNFINTVPTDGINYKVLYLRNLLQLKGIIANYESIKRDIENLVK